MYSMTTKIAVFTVEGVCPPSICLSWSGVASQWFNLLPKFIRHLIAPTFWFSETNRLYEKFDEITHNQGVQHRRGQKCEYLPSCLSGLTRSVTWMMVC